MAKVELRGRLRSQGAGSRLRFGWARRCSMRRITASLTMVSETSGSSSYSLARRRHLPSQPSVLSVPPEEGPPLAGHAERPLRPPAPGEEDEAGAAREPAHDDQGQPEQEA